ncbi:Sir2 family protein [Nitzschia inconspicua]|uniref:Sir2 family protein n=1 Tax=Nitzschia inconspicua TaxID=303405 RepID=A0A9K3L8S7_9STRA|nr:Sir2 family protein [Nitzschia inconspicua]
MDISEFCRLLETNIKDIYNLGDGTASSTESKPIFCNHCQRPLVKPTTVLFGRKLPSQFFECVQKDLPQMDLLIIAGTSLVVSPANSRVYQCPKSTKRVVVNHEAVGEDLGIDYTGKDEGRDFFAQGSCDDVFLDLAVELGWLQYLLDDIDELPPSSAKLLRERKKSTETV